MSALKSSRSDRGQDQQAQSPVHASRLPIFPPTRRPTSCSSWEFDTYWGKGMVEGRLGQMHRDLLDAARMVAERQVVDAGEKLHLLLDAAKLRAALGWDSVNYAQLEARLEDMRVAKVSTIIKASGIKLVEGMVSSYCMAQEQRGGRGGGKVAHLVIPRGGERPRALLPGMWRISFSQSWSKLILQDHQYSYPLRQVLKMRHGVSQALARFCLSHRWVNEKLEDVLQKLEAGGRERDCLDVLIVDQDALLSLGIEVQDGIVKYGQRPDARLQPRECATPTP